MHTFNCSCGTPLLHAQAKIGGRIDDEGDVEVCVDCPTCDAQHYTYVHVSRFEEGAT